MVDWNSGQMDGFSHWGEDAAGSKGYDYVERSEIQPYRTMAQQYVLADAMFPTEFGGSFTAHLTLVAGTDDISLPGEAEVDFPSKAPDDCDSPPGTVSSYLTDMPYRQVHHSRAAFPASTSSTRSRKCSTTREFRGSTTRPVARRRLLGAVRAIKYVRYGPDWATNIIAPQSKVLTDPQYGQLASVSWVTPRAPIPIIRRITAIKGRPGWPRSSTRSAQSSYWPTSAIIVLWDDWGGFYDNASPPQLDYRGLGIRVPCLIISPYAKTNYVDHTQYEYGSILRFIEEVNGIPAGSIGPTSQGLHRRTRGEPRRRLRLHAESAAVLGHQSEVSDRTLLERTAVERLSRLRVDAGDRKIEIGPPSRRSYFLARSADLRHELVQVVVVGIGVVHRGIAVGLPARDIPNMPAVEVVSTTLVSSTLPAGVSSTSVFGELPALFATTRLPLGSFAIATGALSGAPARISFPHVDFGYLHLNVLPSLLTAISSLTSNSLALLNETTVLSPRRSRRAFRCS